MNVKLFPAIALVFSNLAFASGLEFETKKPLHVEKTNLDIYSRKVIEAMEDVNERLRNEGSDLQIINEYDYFAAGKIYSVEALSKLDTPSLLSFFDGDYCRGNFNKLYDVRTVVGWRPAERRRLKKAELSGSFRAEAMYPKGLNLMTVGATYPASMYDIKQMVGQDFEVTRSNGDSATLRCVTVLRSTSSAQSASLLNGYLSNLYAPLQTALGL